MTLAARAARVRAMLQGGGGMQAFPAGSQAQQGIEAAVGASHSVEMARARRRAAIWSLDLQPTPKLTLHALSEEADAGGTCSVKADYLVSRVGVTRMTIFVTLKALEGAGLLTRTRRPGSATTYTLHVGEVSA